MSAPHPEASAATTKGLIDVADKLDDCLLAFRCVSDLLTVFSERLEEELRFLKLSKDAYAISFLKRYDVLRSLEYVAEIHLYDTIEDMTDHADTVREIYANARNIQPKTE